MNNTFALLLSLSRGVAVYSHRRCLIAASISLPCFPKVYFPSPGGSYGWVKKRSQHSQKRKSIESSLLLRRTILLLTTTSSATIHGDLLFYDSRRPLSPPIHDDLVRDGNHHQRRPSLDGDPPQRR